jgi:hypothetical protein
MRHKMSHISPTSSPPFTNNIHRIYPNNDDSNRIHNTPPPTDSPSNSTSIGITLDKGIDHVPVAGLITNAVIIAIGKPVLSLVSDEWLGKGYLNYIKNEKTVGTCAFNAIPFSLIATNLYQASMNLPCVTTDKNVKAIGSNRSQWPADL